MLLLQEPAVSIITREGTAILDPASSIAFVMKKTSVGEFHIFAAITYIVRLVIHLCYFIIHLC